MHPESDIRLNRITLPNGLRVVHSRDASTAMVALNILYDTGARDETPALTGLAHLFEHNFFGGSQNIPDFDKVITEAGGEDNAWTGNDFTNYYEVAPAHNAETLFYLESDRMLAPLFPEAVLEVQRSVVVEEFKQQCLNRPYGDMGHHLRRMVYGGSHPYSWPVIGLDFSHIERAVRNDLVQWFREHYSPANAVLAVTGNITAEKAFALAQKWFGSIPGRPVPQRIIPEVAPLTPMTPKTVYGRVPATSVTVAYLMDGYGTDQYYAADAFTDLLSDGKASAYYRRLLVGGDGTFAEADASISGSEHQGMLMLTGRLADEGTDPMHAVRLLVEQAQTVIKEGVSDHDLQRIKNKRRSMTILGNMNYLSRAQNIAMSEMHGENPTDALDRYLALSADDITSTARKLLDSNPAVLIYRPEKVSAEQ